MKRAFLIFYLAAQPAEAAACHRFHHWAYPWPQRCGVVVVARAVFRPPARPVVEEDAGRREALEQLKLELNQGVKP
jgi:hypothetical protein